MTPSPTSSLSDLVAFVAVTAEDFDELVDLRIAAMRESLERLGRFDPARARDRLRASFYPEHTEFIVVDGQRIGFYTFRPADDGFHLDHLYVHPGYQSRGIGSQVIRRLLARSDSLRMAVHLGALRDSASNRFYQRHGFVKAREDEWDIHYKRPPEVDWFEMNPPETLELARVRLRRPSLSDAEAIFEYGSDPKVARYADWPVRTRMDGLVESLLARGERWESGAEFYWVITLVGKDRAIGGISCRVDQDSAEVGFLLNRRHWGKGLATEAARAVVDWVLSVPSVRRVWATCDAENRASVRVLEKLGLSLEDRLPRFVVRPNLSGEPRDALRYSIVKPLA